LVADCFEYTKQHQAGGLGAAPKLHLSNQTREESNYNESTFVLVGGIQRAMNLSFNSA
jgi:hypothetical protein